MVDLHDRMRARVEELRRELELGEGRLRELERETLSVQQTMLRIRGAIQVLTELDDSADPEPGPTVPDPGTGAS